MRTCVSLCALLVLLSGCGEQEFSHRAEFSSLEPYAQVYVNQVLAKYFGEPGNMVVWERLPLKEHLATGSVKAASADALDLDLSEPHQAIGAGAEVLWMGGPLAGQPSAWISSWDEKLHSAQLAPKLANKPEAGTPVIVGPGQVLVRGRMLYAEHCLHCHGITGDGAGPTAQYLNPRPRDYRKGLFKFTVTQASERASRADLSRVIENGIPGTTVIPRRRSPSAWPPARRRRNPGIRPAKRPPASGRSSTIT